MYLGHEGAALAARPGAPGVPMYAFLLASWSPDLTGVGHWLPGAAVLCAVFYVVARRRWGSTAGLILAALVLSHLVLDLVVGLQILPGGRFLGLNLSTHSGAELALELAAIGMGFCAYLIARRPVDPLMALSFIVVLAFTFGAWSFADDPDVHDPSPERLAVQIVGLIVTSALLIAADRRSVRRRNLAPT